MTKKDKDKEKKKEDDDHQKMMQLTSTVRGWPFLPEEHKGLGQDMMRFERNKEVFQRIKRSVGIGYDKVWYVKRIFLEAAIDEPQMFADGYTHYSNEKGFHTLQNDIDFDNYLGFVSSIDATESKNESRNWNNPHPKWYEFRKRIDKVVKGIKDDWDLKDVFIEASRNKKLDTYLRGKHYKRGLGFVHSCQV